MKNIHILFLLLFATSTGVAQQNKTCRDVVTLHNGSVFRGKVVEYQAGGDLVMTTWSGGQIRIPAVNVKKIIQKCFDEKQAQVPLVQRPYTFPEAGWYHSSRLEMMWGESGAGFGFQHSSGLKINRFIGVGAGVGIENLTYLDDDVRTFPIFAEARGYLSPKNISPMYAVGLGWAIAGKEMEIIDGSTEDWQGGWMLQGQIGYRFGNNFTVHGGLRFQRKTRIWSNWWNTVEGEDKILQKRFDLGLGILL